MTRTEKQPDLNVGSPLVTVIIPVYQGEKVVLGAVRSVLRQTYQNVELLVVDDGSTDATRRVLGEISDPRLRILTQANAGTASARNLALGVASGQYVGFLDCDDRWLPEKIQTELAVLALAKSRPAIIYSTYYPVDDFGRLLSAPKRLAYQGNLFNVLLDEEDFLVPSVCLFERKIFDEIGCFEVGHYHEDHEFILRAARHYSIYPTLKTLVVYRQSTSGKCRSILKDYDRAVLEERRIITATVKYTTPEERHRLLQNVNRSLYCRFLMYGFNQHARRLSGDVDLNNLKGMKGRLAFIFAKTGMNVLEAARCFVQTLYRYSIQNRWKKMLASNALDLDYH